jgi:hypothetical protein
MKKKQKQQRNGARSERRHTQKFLSYFFLFFYLLKLNVPFLSPCQYPAMQPAQLREVQEDGIVLGNIT